MQHLEQSNHFGVPAPKAGALPTALHPDQTNGIIHDYPEKINHIIIPIDGGKLAKSLLYHVPIARLPTGIGE